MAVVPRADGVGGRRRQGRPPSSGTRRPAALLWKTPIPGIAVSSPIVWGDRVFVTTAVSSDPKAGFRHGPLRRRRAVEGRRPSTLAGARARQASRQGAVGARRARGRAEDEAAPQVEPGLVDAGDRRHARGRLVRLGGAVRLRHGRQAALEAATSASSTPAGSTIPTTSGASPARRSSGRTW